MDKLTDIEIVKALEESINFDEPYESDFTLIRIEYIKNALDLINRLQADCENYKQVAENQQKITLDRGFEIKELKAEIERLKKGWKADILLTQNTKAEAYKECIEKVKTIICDNTYPDFDKNGRAVNIWKAEAYKEIDNLLK